VIFCAGISLKTIFEAAQIDQGNSAQTLKINFPEHIYIVKA
jgi:hypothetical protein